MNNLKTYEGFFNFFKKSSEEDKIAELYIKRLKKVKGLCPYPIKYKTGNVTTDSDGAKYYRYDIIFEDTPIHIIKGEIIDNQYNRFSEYTKKQLIDDGSIFKNEKIFYQLYLPYPINDNVLASWEILEKLYELIKNVFEKDTKLRKINKIKDEINPAADLIDDED